MRYTITGRNMNITDGLKDAVVKKLSKLEKYFAEDTEAWITLSVKKDFQKIEVTIPTKVGIVRAEDEDRDVYSSIDDVVEKIEKQIKKYKTKLIDKKQSAESLSKSFIEEDYDEYNDENEIVIAKVKKFAMKPMDPEEACLQMEMLGHNFFVFLNPDTNQVNVVYKRNNNTYGIIEPEN